MWISEKKEEKKMNFSKRIIAIVLCALMFCNVTVFAQDTQENVQSTAQEKEQNEYRYNPDDPNSPYAGYTPEYKNKLQSFQLQLFSEVFKLYKETHLYEFSEEELTEAFIMKLIRENPDLVKLFISTLLGTMDPYSAYYESGTGLASDGSSTGYGISVGDESDFRIRGLDLKVKGNYIINVIKDSNAQKAGIEIGDRIISIEGIPTDGNTVDGVMRLIRELPYVEKEIFDENGQSLGIPNEPEFVTDEITGKKQYVLHMTLQKPYGEIYEIKLTKGKMLVSSVSYDMPEGKSYGYITISGFRDENMVEEFKEILKKIKKAHRTDLIIDIRGNGGGVMDYAVKMANALISEKDRLLLYLNSRNHTEPEAIFSEGGGEKFDRITVLVDEYTASAAEMFASILDYNCGATIVGTKTYGKGVGQETYSLAGGDIFTITSFEILDVNKNSYNEIGITPDAEIKVCLKKYDFPTDLEIFNYENYKALGLGSTGEVVMGLERRLQMLGYLRAEFVDGKYDEYTQGAISTFQLYYGKRSTGVLDDSDVHNITVSINKLKNYYYTYDSQYEVADMSFRSTSQAKRRAKELERESAKVEADRKAYEDAIMAEIEAEIKAEKEQTKAQTENQNP